MKTTTILQWSIIVMLAVMTAVMLVGGSATDLDRSVFKIDNGFNSGTAWAYTERIVVTAAHITFPVTNGFSITVNGDRIPVSFLAMDEVRDVAVFWSHQELTPVTRNSSFMARGSPITTYGYPFGGPAYLSQGVIAGSAVNTFWLYDARIAPGMSGGVLLDSSRRVIGMVVFGKQAEFGDTIPHAIQMDDIERTVNELINE